MLWTPRVWPGAILVEGEIAGTWRRAGAVMTVQNWRPLSRAERDAVTAEAESLPLPGTSGRSAVRWTTELKPAAVRGCLDRNGAIGRVRIWLICAWQ
jgi:hypothetical protein